MTLKVFQPIFQFNWPQVPFEISFFVWLFFVDVNYHTAIRSLPSNWILFDIVIACQNGGSVWHKICIFLKHQKCREFDLVTRANRFCCCFTCLFTFWKIRANAARQNNNRENPRKIRENGARHNKNVGKSKKITAILECGRNLAVLVNICDTLTGACQDFSRFFPRLIDFTY